MSLQQQHSAEDMSSLVQGYYAQLENFLATHSAFTQNSAFSIRFRLENLFFCKISRSSQLENARNIK